MPLYSEMTKWELENEMESLREAGQRAYDDENWSEYEIHMKKWYLAKSYMLRDTLNVEIGRTYALTEEYDRITVSKLEGIMAWGIKESTATETAVPIAMLVERD
jgi:hypothetical protein